MRSVLFNSEAVQTDRAADKKKTNSHLTAKSHPRDFFIFISHQMCERYSVRIYARTRAQRSQPSRRSRWSQAERAVVGRRWEGEGRGGSGTGASCFCTKSPPTTHLLPPLPTPDQRRDSLYFAINWKQWAVSCFNSPTPFSHYSPNYRHPIGWFLCSS